MVHTSAVVGGRANLPCSLTSDKPGDRPALVLWYRGKSGAPIYRSETVLLSDSQCRVLFYTGLIAGADPERGAKSVGREPNF